jgi:hypothetical protein
VRNVSLAPAYRVPIPTEIAAWRLPTSSSRLHMPSTTSPPRSQTRSTREFWRFAHGGSCGRDLLLRGRRNLELIPLGRDLEEQQMRSGVL